MSVLYFLMVAAPLIFLHECGHFIMARLFGVRCEQFAVGVGPVVLRTVRWGTEFSIRAFPLGGYVSMLGMHPDEEIDPQWAGQALTDKPVWQRFLIYLAGPLMNILIAAPLFMAYELSEAERAGTVVGYVGEGSPAAEAGLQPGDLITAIDGTAVTYFDDILAIVRNAPERELVISIVRDGAPLDLRAVPDRIEALDPIVGLRRVEYGQLGMGWAQRAAAVHVVAGSTADTGSGLETFDLVTSVAGAPVSSWAELEAALAGVQGEVTLEVRRPVRTDDAFAAVYVSRTETVTLTGPMPDLEAAGLFPAHTSVFHVVAGSPADLAGVRPGDRVLTSEGRQVADVNRVAELLMSQPPHEVALEVERAGQVLALTMTTTQERVLGEMRNGMDVVFVGLVGMDGLYVSPELLIAPWSRRISDAVYNGLRETVEFSSALVFMVGAMIGGQVDSSNFGGPIMMADAASRAAEAGWLALMRMAALLSVNLGIINLVPVPGLDGGHLLVLAVEGIRRRPLSNRTRQILNFVGIVSIVLLMLFAFKNDIERYWVDIASWLNG